MLFKVKLTIPANTTKANYVSTDIQLFPGKVSRIDIRFPPGCCDLAKVAIFEKEHQLWPTLYENWISGDTFPISWDDDYDIKEIPFIFNVRGYNDDTDYPHTITVHINLITGKSGWEDYFKRLIGGLS